MITKVLPLTHTFPDIDTVLADELIESNYDDIFSE